MDRKVLTANLILLGFTKKVSIKVVNILVKTNITVYIYELNSRVYKNNVYVDSTEDSFAETLNLINKLLNNE